jgi:hypothetical protein
MDALLWDHSINEDAKEVPQGLKPEEEIARFTVCPQWGLCHAAATH